MKGFKHSFFVSVSSLFITLVWASSPKIISFPVLNSFSYSAPNPNSFILNPEPNIEPLAGDTPVTLKYPMHDQSTGMPSLNDYKGGLYLNDPSNIKTDITYDTDSGVYDVSQKMGKLNYRPPLYMTPEEYMDYQFKKSMKSYWKERSSAESMTQKKNKSNLIAPIKINSQIFDRIFGSNIVDIRPQGSAELIFGVNSSHTENPAIPVKQRRITTFDFDEKIQLSLVGKIGDKMKITTNYNTQATFDFENKMKLEWTGGEDDIIKKIEAGNVSLPLNSTLISGSQSLFGLKTQLQFGKTTITSVISQEKGQKKEINIENGAQTNSFVITGDAYESNKHFFVSQYFKDNYDVALAHLPVIQSEIYITKMEVWITNTSSNINETRNIIALTDLGENLSAYLTNTTIPTYSNTVPDNTANWLNPKTLLTGANDSIRNKDKAVAILTAPPLNLRAVQDFEKVLSARKLSASEFTFNPKLGFVSLNTNINPDQVVAVAFQYTYNGGTYQVGELSTDGIADPKCLMVKMLKSTNVSPKRDPLLWELMMKNVYSMGAYQIKPDNFKLDVYYNNPTTGTDVPVIPETDVPITVKGKPLIQIMNLDRINTSGDPVSDGVFDFIDGVTVNAANGRVYFPVREPFGPHLRAKINPSLDIASPLNITAEKYVYDQLYDSTKYGAQQFPDKNRFKMKGSFKSASGSEINLNAPNIPEHSVIVTAGGVPLTENVDYTVDYALGKVKIINDGILKSGTPIKISFESNMMFGLQQKTLLGTHVDYRVNKDFHLGGTALRLNERPLMQKVNIGDEPIKNTVLGFDGNYRNEFPFLTRMVDKLPFYSTKEMSTITASGEVAALIPGHSRAINSKDDKGGNAYIDDFEGSQTPIDIKSVGQWSLASTPQGGNPLWPEGSRTDTIYGFNRAKLAWYNIDPMFMRQTANLTPSYYTKAQQSDNYMREILETEIFPKKESSTGQPVPLQTLDLAFYPDERGPYNYDAGGVSGISAGTQPNGLLNNPSSRWGGIMRKIETNDFEAANVQFVQIWMMDPFNADLGSPYNNLQQTSGELVVQLGNVSEDVCRDGKKSFENGLPTSPSDQTHPTTNTSWGKVPTIQAIVNAFDNDLTSRTAQDVGLDGLNNADEATYFTKFLNSPSIAGLSAAAHTAINADPSSDIYHYYRGDDYDAAQLGTLARYKNYNGLEGNSPVSTGSYPTSSTTLPSTEDINRDNNLSESEGYFQYRVKISKSNFQESNVGNNFITDVVSGGGTTLDNTGVDAKWYQLKIPVREFESRYGNIEDFKSIRFIRMILRGFSKPVVLRMARVELIRGEWRKYQYDLAADGEYLGNDNAGTSFDVSAVNYEENGTKNPVNYVLPPGIAQQQSFGTATPVHLNEQAMALKVCNLQDGDARATYKNVDFDVRSYKKLKMFIHAEAQAGSSPVHDGDVTCFIRLGSDYTQNYYEYEIPLRITPPGSYDNNSDPAQKQVWDEVNNMELEFSVLQDIKQKRNAAIFNGGASLSKRFEITITDPQGQSRKVYVKGNPNFSALKTIMIGVRNPKKTPADVDDGFQKCVEVWVNELRLSDFNEKGGWASTAHVTAKLADLGIVTLSGNYSTPGWGSIDKRVSERQRETRYEYDISSQIMLSKFLPSNWGIMLPMYIGYSNAIIRPQYNPLDPDIFFNSTLNNPALPQSYKDSLKQVTIDKTTRRSINFTNVKKERGKNSKRNNIYDIENFAFNFSFTEFQNHGPQVEFNNIRDYRSGVVYGYSANPKNIQPFKKVKLLNKKVFALVKDFNFFSYPNKIAFLLDVDRHYAEKLQRNTTGMEFPMDTFFDKHYNMMRGYDVKYDLAKSLKLDFHADNSSRIMEPYGAIDTKAEKDTIKKNLLKGGINTNYAQHTKIDYTVPLAKFPLTDWVTANAGYSADYKWTRALFSMDTLGNTITNGNQKTLNLQGNMTTLYNKIPFFKKVNKGIKKPEEKKTPPKAKTPPKGKELPKIGIQTPLPKNPKDTTKKAKKLGDYLFPQYVARTVMMLKNVSVNYTNSAGMALAGYTEKTHMFGMNQGNYNSPFGLAPGLGFLFGQQQNFGKKGNTTPEFTDYAANNKWLVQQPLLNTPYTKTKTQNITARASIEPMPSFKIELTANKNKTQNYSEFFRWAQDTNTGIFNYQHQSPTETGNFSMSFISWGSAFEKVNVNNGFSSDAFTRFLKNRSLISEQLSNRYGDHGTYTGLDNRTYHTGYGETSQQTMMFSFLSAYSGQDPHKSSLQTFPKMPLPNWRVTYDGLSKIKPLKKVFKTVTLSHAYRSSYSFSYTNNLKSSIGKDGKPTTFDENNNYIFYEQMNSISIAEQFSPLIKVDLTMQSGWQFNFEIKKDRNLSLSFANNQLTEIDGKEFVTGTGYRWKNLELKNPFSRKKSAKPIKSDLVLKADFSIKQNLTVIRKVVEGVTQPTSGQKIFSLKTSADYMITQRITARLFYDRVFTNPRISTSFKTSNSNGGISIRFSLS
ncbi:MAG: cell surface protein SprA [Bacteroidetes bacterium]|nr:cell surface protein SprA [Bacteroidota bacterium]